MENGQGFEYAKDGRIITLTRFEKGYLKGKEEINRKNPRGNKHGLWKVFYDDGITVKWEGRFIDGKKNGYFREYSPKGKLLETTKWENGEVVDNSEALQAVEVRKEYYDNAQVKSVGNYNKKGKPVGIFRAYSPEGTISSSKIYLEGVLIGEGGIVNEAGVKQGLWTYYYTDGSIRSKGHYKNGKKIKDWIYYHPNGKVEQKGKYQDDGRLTGVWNWYYESGNLEREESFRRGKEDGIFVEYSDTGKVLAKGEFLDGLEEGEWYYYVGDHREEGNYEGGYQTGVWKHYYDNDKLRFEGTYIDGEPDGKHTYYHRNGNKMIQGSYIMGKKRVNGKDLMNIMK